MENNSKGKSLSWITWLLIISLWSLVSYGGFIDAVLMPSPTKVLGAFVDIFVNGYNRIPFLTHLGVSFKRLLLASIGAIILAVPLGLLSGYFRPIHAIVDSIVQFIRPIPPLAYYTLLVLWMGIDDSSKIMLLFIAAFAPIYLTCVSAVKSVNEAHIHNAESLGASKLQIFVYVVFPASLPAIFVGIRTAFGFAYTTLVSAEMVAATKGIGWMVIDASRYMKTEVMFVGVIVMGITGVIMDRGLLAIENKLIFWKGKE